MLQSGGQNQKRPTIVRIGCVTPVVPNTSKWGTKSEVAHNLEGLATSPLPSRGSPTLQRGGGGWGGKIRSGPQFGEIGYVSPTLQCGRQNQQWWIGYGTLAVWGVPNASKRGQNQKRPRSGRIGYVTIAIRGSPTLQSGQQNQQWPTKGRIGYCTPAVWGVPNASTWGTKSEVAIKRAD